MRGEGRGFLSKVAPFVPESTPDTDKFGGEHLVRPIHFGLILRWRVVVATHSQDLLRGDNASNAAPAGGWLSRVLKLASPVHSRAERS